MRKLLPVAILACFSLSNTAIAAPKSVAIKEISLLTSGIQSDGVTNSAGNVITFTSTTSATLDVSISATNLAGANIWNKVIDSGQNELATAVAVDAKSNIWLAGTSASSLAEVPQAVQSNPANPDGVVVENLPPMRRDMDQISIWQLSPTGDLISTYSYPLKESALITAFAVDAKGATIAGARKSGAIVLSVNSAGVFGKLTSIGSTKTSINAVVRNADGSVSAFGSSAETLGGKKLAGAVDGILLKVSKSGVLTSVIRSSAPSAKRNWSSSTPSLLLTGSVITSKTSESAITKFTPAFAPTWTMRFASRGNSVAANGPSGRYFVALAPTSPISGLTSAKFLPGQGVVLGFDSKGTLVSGYTNVAMGEPLGIVYTSEGGVNVLTRDIAAQTLSIFHLDVK